ncbi:MAG TPA: hypothetical protein VGX68_06340 [Thermoanaerobaculia bacterium]|jgi:hypothetical protein|nr:hypothetical protein [Thermoanaerobaculia bacterium]
MQIFVSPTMRRVGILLALGALLAIPSLAQPTINRGVDLLETAGSGATGVDFASNPIPAGFFCPGSAPFTGSVGLQGVPLATVPPGVAGNADTIVERLTAGVFSGGTATFAVVLRALRLTSINDVEIFCPDEGPTFWRVDACSCGLQPTSKLTVKIDPACGTCGTANGTLSLQVCLRFTRVDTGQTAGPISQNLTLNLANMSWCYRPGTSTTVVSETFGVDSNCDGQPDLTLPPSSNFHPGWSCATQAGDCWAQYAALTHCHKNFTNPGAHDHCINPVCGKRN